MIVNLLRHTAFHKAIGKYIDVPHGLGLMKDKSVPIKEKLIAVGIAFAAVAGLMVLQVPLESLLAVFAPIVGLVADFAFDGIEIIVLPILISAALLPTIHEKMSSPVISVSGNVIP